MLRVNGKLEQGRSPDAASVALALKPAAFPLLAVPLRYAPDSRSRQPHWVQHSRITTHTYCSKGGTVNRPLTHVSHRKQTTGHIQGRNFPVHFLFPFFRRNPMALALRSLGGRSSISVINNRGEATHLSVRLMHPGLPGRCFTRATHLSSTTHQLLVTNHALLHPKTLRVLGWLPGTVSRVESLPSPEKQTTAYPSTRNVPVHATFRRIFACSVPAIAAAKFQQTLDPVSAQFCATMDLEFSGETT